MSPVVGFTYWQEEDQWIGYLDEFPDYTTQGICFEELKENLARLYKELGSGVAPNGHRHAELEVT